MCGDNFGQAWGKLGRSWPGIGQSWPWFGRTWDKVDKSIGQSVGPKDRQRHWPLSTNVGPNSAPKLGKLNRIGPSLARNRAKLGRFWTVGANSTLGEIWRIRQPVARNRCTNIGPVSTELRPMSAQLGPMWIKVGPLDLCFVSRAASAQDLKPTGSHFTRRVAASAYGLPLPDRAARQRPSSTLDCSNASLRTPHPCT